MDAPPPAIVAPPAVAPGGLIRVVPTGLQRPVRVQVRLPGGWVTRGGAVTKAGGAVFPRAPLTGTAVRIRARGADGTVSRSRTVRLRRLRLAAVGDVNLGAQPGAAIAANGAAWPWQSVGPRLRAADIAVANLECAVSDRGVAEQKTFTFRSRPSSLPPMAKVGGIDVAQLANNHTGDYGRTALLDTLRGVRAAGMVPVGAGSNASQAYRPVVVQRLGLKVAFVAFSEVLPFEFRATGATPGTAWAFPERITSSVRAATQQADVVVALFHWGIERDFKENARQRQLAAVALAAGATSVIGSHPHVLQPIRSSGTRKLIAYSLGNFVFGANSPGTERTGILEADLDASGVRDHRFVPARINGTRPILGR